MSGRSSKVKGRRVEYCVRDYLRKLGYEAHRVPLSGASEYVGKGDVIINRHRPDEVIFEVKARRDEFKKIYAFFEATPKAFTLGFHNKDYLVNMSTDYLELALHTHYVELLGSKDVDRIVKLVKYLGKADILAIKQDRKPIIFIKFTKMVG